MNKATAFSTLTIILWALGVATPARAQDAPSRSSTRAPEGESASSTSQPDAMTPHPRAAVEEPTESPFSFSTPMAWPPPAARVDVSGYVLPQFEVVSLPAALPRDRMQYGVRGTRAGFALHGTPVDNFRYMVHVVVLPAGTSNLTILSPTTAPAMSIQLSTATQTTLDIEEMSAGYRPAKWFLAKVGIFRMPFSAAQTTPIPKQMFPFRAPQTTEFQSGADAGMSATLAPFDARLQVTAGAFLGTSLGFVAPQQTIRGPVLVAQVAAHPLGAMNMREGDQGRGPLRFALGVASMLRDATAFDATGYEASQFNDVRLTAWARAQARGAYLQAEYLRRARTDSLSGRPLVSEGGYVQASYFQPIGKIALGPIGRFGSSTFSQDFAARTFTSWEGGIVFYPRADDKEPERLRILVEYLTATVRPLAEVQREGLLQLQMEF